MNTARIAIAALVATTLAPGAPRAEDFIPLRIMSPALALDLARSALEACRARGFQVAVAVVDRFGVPQVLLRDSLAGPHTPESAIGKARAAVSFRTATEELAALTQPGQPSSGIRHLLGFVFLGGGVPVEAGGLIVGGVGVSGAPGGTEDDACARAGIAAVEDRLSM